MTCLTVTPDSAAEAVAEGAGLIVTHHPILFRAVKRLTDATPEGRMLLALARAGVAVYSPHTAFDDAADGHQRARWPGGSAWAASARCAPRRRPGSCKVVVFTPEKDLDRVADAMFAAGAGRIGQYSECSFRLLGTGTFFGSEATQPDRRPEGAARGGGRMAAGGGLSRAERGRGRDGGHPTQPIPTRNRRMTSTRCGRRRRRRASAGLGALPEPRPLRAFAEAVQPALRLRPGTGDRRPATSGEPRRPWPAAAGGELLPDAVRACADVLLTGEARFHDHLAAQAQGLAPGAAGTLRHGAPRRRGVWRIALRAEWPDVAAWASRRERDPAGWV